MKIVSADNNKIEELRDWVDQILDAVGHPEAYVTDESLVSDFILSIKELKRINNKLNLDINFSDYIFKVAERLRDKNE